MDQSSNTSQSQPLPGRADGAQQRHAEEAANDLNRPTMVPDDEWEKVSGRVHAAPGKAGEESDLNRPTRTDEPPQADAGHPGAAEAQVQEKAHREATRGESNIEASDDAGNEASSGISPAAAEKAADAFAESKGLRGSQNALHDSHVSGAAEPRDDFQAAKASRKAGSDAGSRHNDAGWRDAEAEDDAESFAQATWSDASGWSNWSTWSESAQEPEQEPARATARSGGKGARRRPPRARQAPPAARPQATAVQEAPAHPAVPEASLPLRKRRGRATSDDAASPVAAAKKPVRRSTSAEEPPAPRKAARSDVAPDASADSAPEPSAGAKERSALRKSVGETRTRPKETRARGSRTSRAPEQAAARQRKQAPAATRERPGKSRYVPALDGLRSFAVLAVIFYHMGTGFAPGGLMGVTVFFVISGYLINGLLVAERERTGSISLKAFWLRRVRRLFPAILLAVVGTAALCTMFNHTLLDKMRPDIVPSLLFYNNWWQIFRDLSYFEAAGAPSPLTHFWSLSIEEQFYVVWPLLLLLMYRLGMRKTAMSRVVLALVVALAVLMGVMYDPAGDPSRVYYGTDTRAMSLLLGVWLAFMWPSAAFGTQPGMGQRSRGTWLGFNVAGLAALVGLVVIVCFTTGYSGFPYYGGILLTSVLSAVLIAVLAVPGTWMARLFALKPLVWIGKRSYGMYLWHYPIILLTTNPNSTVAAPWWLGIVQLALVFAVSALSYTFVEDPIRKGKLSAWWRSRQEGAPAQEEGGPQHRRSAGASVAETLKAAIPAGCFALMLGMAGFGVAAVPPTDYAAQYAGQARTGASSAQVAGADASSSSSSAAEKPDEPEEESGESSASAAASSTSAAKSAVPTYDEVFNVQQVGESGQPVYEPLLIGDSVAAGAEDEFYRVFPYGHIDAVVNRNIWESPYPSYRDAGQAGDYIVICLGTNNAVVDWQIDDELLNSVEDDKHVFMVNTRNTCDWLESTNAEIAAAPERHPNVTVIDWYGASEGHDEYFVGDGTHLSDAGAHAYIMLIQDAIRKSFASAQASAS